MDEISMFATLRPEPPGDGGTAVVGARARVTAVLDSPPARASGTRTGKGRVVLAGGLVTAAATAAVVVPATLPGSAGTPRAWAVGRNSDGTVTVTVDEVFHDLAGLQQALRAKGVPAVVAVIPWKTSSVRGGIEAVQACGYYPLDRAPAAVQRAVVTHPLARMTVATAGPGAKPLTKATSDAAAKNTAVHRGTTVLPDPFIWTFRPSKLPRGAVVFISASPAAASGAISAVVSNPLVLRSDRLPGCVPGRGGASQWHSR